MGSSPAASALSGSMSLTVADRKATNSSFDVADSTANAYGCDCSWIWRDNCTDFSYCSLTCREQNPDGPCHYAGGDAPARCPLTGNFTFNHTDGYKTRWAFEQRAPHVFS